MEPNNILAKVGDKEITLRDVEFLVKSFDPQTAEKFKTTEGLKTLVDHLVNQELFYLDAIDKGMDKEESYNEEVDKQKATILKQYAITKCLNSVSVSDSEAENYYNDNKEEFKSGESVKASHILVSNENDANEVIAELNRGSSFEDIAKKSSQCPSKSSGGDLGYFTRGRMVPEFEQAAFSMEKDEISSSPVKTQFGYHIIKLTDKKGPGVLTFEEVKSQIKQQLGGKKQEKLFYSKIGEFKKKYPVNVLI